MAIDPHKAPEPDDFKPAQNDDVPPPPEEIVVESDDPEIPPAPPLPDVETTSKVELVPDEPDDVEPVMGDGEDLDDVELPDQLDGEDLLPDELRYDLDDGDIPDAPAPPAPVDDGTPGEEGLAYTTHVIDDDEDASVPPASPLMSGDDVDYDSGFQLGDTEELGDGPVLDEIPPAPDPFERFVRGGGVGPRDEPALTDAGPAGGDGDDRLVRTIERLIDTVDQLDTNIQLLTQQLEEGVGARAV